VDDAGRSLVVVPIAVTVPVAVAGVVWRLLLRVLRVLVRVFVLSLLLELVVRKIGSSGFGRGRRLRASRSEFVSGSVSVPRRLRMRLEEIVLPQYTVL
jgi:hypothetical protein